jgi:hypothetical protein
VLEHVESPGVYLRQINLHCFLFVSMPIVYALGAIRARSTTGPASTSTTGPRRLRRWMEMHGFMLPRAGRLRDQAGRESIYSFAFKRYRWPK